MFGLKRIWKFVYVELNFLLSGGGDIILPCEENYRRYKEVTLEQITMKNMSEANVRYGIINPKHLIDKKIYRIFSRNGNITQIKYDLCSFFKTDQLIQMMTLFPELKGRHPELAEQNELDRNICKLSREIESAEIDSLIFSSEFIMDMLEDEIEKEEAYPKIDALVHCICDGAINVNFVAEKHPLKFNEDDAKDALYTEFLGRITNGFVRESNVKEFIVKAVFGEGDYFDEKGIEFDVADTNLGTATLSDEVALFVLSNIDKGPGKFQIPYTTSIEKAVGIKNHQKCCSFKLIYQLNPDEYFYGKLVCGERIKLGEELSSSIPQNIVNEIDFVTPVPNTGTYYAMGLAKGISKPYIQGIMKTLTTERSFQLADIDMRKKFLWSKIKPITELVEGKTIAVVDEAIFTGSTLKVVCEMLHESNVKRIYLCIPTPRCRYHCNYLVHPDRAMLLEYLNEPMLTDYFDVDGIYFQEDSKFEKILDAIGYNLCRECFLGGQTGSNE